LDETVRRGTTSPHTPRAFGPQSGIRSACQLGYGCGDVTPRR